MIKQGYSVGTAALVALVAASSAGARAEVPGRYSMSPTQGGFVRLDTQTGTMALCTQKDAAAPWSCADMPESADSSRQRIEALENENKALKDEVKRLEEVFGQAPGAEAPKSFTVPDEKDVDKAFDYIESMIKKFRERVKKLEDKEGSNGTPL